MHTDYWIGRDQNDVVSDIDETMVKKFRQGKFADQTKEVKEAFYFCMLTLMPCVNNEWQGAEVRLHAKLSVITSVSDEAILYWFLTYFQGQWLQEIKEEEEHKATHSDMRPPNTISAKGSIFPLCSSSGFMTWKKNSGLKERSYHWQRMG